MVVVEKYSSTQISTLSTTAARLLYDSTLNALRFNNASNYTNVVVAKDLANNLSGINNVITTGSLGVNTSLPSKQLEVNSSTGDCLRLTYNDSDGSATNYVDFKVLSGGSFELTPSGGNVDITSHNGSTTGLKLGGTLITSTAVELNYVDTTVGTAMASKALVVDTNKNIVGLNYIEAASAGILGVSSTGDTTVAALSIITSPTTTSSAGIGAGIEFDLVNSSDAVFSAGFFNCVSSVITNDAEKAFFEYKLINAGVLDTVCTISNAGIVTATSFVETSDARVKENIEPVPEVDSMSKLLDVKVKSYNYTFDVDKRHHTGVIAQEIKEILPDVVDISQKHGLDDFHSVHYSGLVPHLVNAVKYLQQEIEELKALLNKK